jgi:hypothetical protein
MIATTSHRALGIILMILAVLTALAALVFLFASSWILSLAHVSLQLPDSDFVIALIKAIGLIILPFSLLLYAAAGDPARYIRVVDALILLLIGGAALNLYALAALHLGAYFPAPYIIARSILELIAAAVFFMLRPKATPT